MWTRVDTGNRVLQWMPRGFKGPFIGGACCDAAFHQNFFHHVAVVIVINVVLHPFNVLFSSTTGVSQYQKGKTSLDLNEHGPYANNLHLAPDRQPHRRQTTSSLKFFYRPNALPDAQPTVLFCIQRVAYRWGTVFSFGNVYCQTCILPEFLWFWRHCFKFLVL